MSFHLQAKTGKIITLRDLLNLKNGRLKSNDERQNELERVVELLHATEGSVVEIAVTEDSRLVGIFYQEASMLKTFADFPEMLLIDSSIGIIDLFMYLYTMKVIDSDGKTEIVGTFVAADNSVPTFRHVIQTFLIHNRAHDKIRIVKVTELDSEQQQVIHEELPNVLTDERFVESYKDVNTTGEMKSTEKIISVDEKLKILCAK